MLSWYGVPVGVGSPVIDVLLFDCRVGWSEARPRIACWGLARVYEQVYGAESMTSREPMDPTQGAAKTMGLPPRYFLYHFDQVADILSMSDKYFKEKMVWYEGKSVGPVDHDLILARNIAPLGEKNMWRIAEPELVRWLRHKGYRVYHRGYAR